MNELPTTLRFQRRNLPHWLVADQTYFVTIRLAGTLPAHVVEELLAEREELRQRRASDEDDLDILRRQFVRIERILDSCGGGREKSSRLGTSGCTGKYSQLSSTGCQTTRDWLTWPGVPDVLLENLAWFENPERGWDVYAAVTMSNHVHMVLRNCSGRSAKLLADLGQYKRHTAREANRLLGRSGTVWARENFDHWCRTPEKVHVAIRYIANNPVTAGLCRQWREWPFTRIKKEWQEVAGL